MTRARTRARALANAAQDGRVGASIDEPLRLTMPRWVHPLWVAAVLLPAMVAGFTYLHVIVTAIFGTAAAVAFAGWLATTYHQPSSRRIIPWHVAVVVALLLQAWEQWSGGYVAGLTESAGAFATPPVVDDRVWLHVFPLALTVVLLLGGVAVFFHHPIGNYLAWLGAALAIVLPLSHVVLLLAGELRYIPGMYTAIPLLAVGGLTLQRLLTDRVERPAR